MEPPTAQKWYLPCTFQYGEKRLSQLNFTENNLFVFNLSGLVILFQSYPCHHHWLCNGSRSVNKYIHILIYFRD